jgi:hypothetical protein
MIQAVGVFYNHTGDVACYDPLGGTDPDSDHDANFWDFQWCAEMLMPFSKDGGARPPVPYALPYIVLHCRPRRVQGERRTVDRIWEGRPIR